MLVRAAERAFGAGVMPVMVGACAKAVDDARNTPRAIAKLQ